MPGHDASKPIGELPGLTAFDALRAEEEPWLTTCYAPPAEFPLIAGRASALIFGETGSGKTALRLALERAWMLPDEGRNWLLVHWPINPLAGVSQDLRGSSLTAFQLTQVFDAVARRLLLYLGRHPDLWQSALPSARTTMRWFCRRFLQGNVTAYVAALAEEDEVAAPAVLSEIVSGEGEDLLSPDAPPTLVIGELSRALARLGMQGIRIVLDDVEPWWEVNPDELTESLQALLSALDLFQHQAFLYVMFLPLELGPRLNNVNAIVRRRVRLFYLSPDDEELLRIVQARLAAALGRADFRLAELGPAETLYAWLRGCGGSSPRGWLETARPFLASYLEIARQTGVFRPLTGQECNEITWRHPPPLRVDPVSDEVTVGWRRIEGLGAGQLAMLRYLSAHAGRICPRKQLYQVYLKATGGTDSRALPKDYANLLDNALDRLREKVEPIPNVPVLLETKRGSGVRLRSFV